VRPLIVRRRRQYLLREGAGFGELVLLETQLSVIQLGLQVFGREGEDFIQQARRTLGLPEFDAGSRDAAQSACKKGSVLCRSVVSVAAQLKRARGVIVLLQHLLLVRFLLGSCRSLGRGLGGAGEGACDQDE